VRDTAQPARLAPPPNVPIPFCRRIGRPYGVYHHWCWARRGGLIIGPAAFDSGRAVHHGTLGQGGTYGTSADTALEIGDPLDALVSHGCRSVVVGASAAIASTSWRFGTTNTTSAASYGHLGQRRWIQGRTDAGRDSDWPSRRPHWRNMGGYRRPAGSGTLNQLRVRSNITHQACTSP
jgi:hypothetical protein